MSQLPKELLQWDGKSNLTIGNLKDDNQLYLELVNSHRMTPSLKSCISGEYVPKSQDKEKEMIPMSDRPVMVLFHLQFPKTERKKGKGTSIVKFIHDKLAKEQDNTIFVIGPLMSMDEDEDESVKPPLVKIADKLGGFNLCAPFSICKDFHKK